MINNRENILIELKAISQIVAEIPAVMPYQIPKGFFQDFPEQLSIIIGKAEFAPQFPVIKEMPFSVPRNYFENFSANLMERIRIEKKESAKEELKTLSPFLNELDNKTPFIAPPGFFEDLADNLVSGMKAIDFVNEELENTAVLSDLKNRPVYTVPAGYFQSLPEVLLKKIKGTIPGTVVKMNTGKRMMRYAAAALTAAIVVSVVFFLSTNENSTGSLASVNAVDTSMTSNISRLSDAAIINYVENEVISADEAPIVTIAPAEIDEEDFKLLLNDISDEALSRYVAIHSDFGQANTN